MTGTDVAGAKLVRSNVSQSDWNGVTSFAGSDWTGTEWWRARRLSTGLLAYLKEKYPYTGNTEGYALQETPTPESYAADVKRLEEAVK